MRAAIHTRYGPPEVVSIQDIPRPEPGPTELLVKVHAATVNRTDAGFRSAEYFISRFFSGLFRPRQQTLGCEFSGVVEDTGAAVQLFKKGDRVFGYNDIRFGGHAEYLTINEREGVVTLPEGMSFVEAAPISEGAHYALNIIRAAGVQRGQRVMVYGATGAIGSAAVQLLNHFGAEITAFSNTKNMDLVKSLGAHQVFDYQREGLSAVSGPFDFVFDAVGKLSFPQCRPLLKEKGIYISTELGKRGANVFYALFTPLLGGKRVLFPLPKTTKEDLLFLRERVEKGEFRPVIDRTYPLEQIVEAYRYVETAQKTGNVVIDIN